MKKFESLPCDLTEEQIKEKGKELAEQLKEISTAEEVLKEHNKKAKEQINTLKAVADLLARQIRDKKEDRDVEVKEEPDIRTKVIRTIRLDDFSIVRARPMTQADFENASQFDMFNEPEPEPDPAHETPKKQPKKQKPKSKQKKVVNMFEDEEETDQEIF